MNRKSSLFISLAVLSGGLPVVQAEEISSFFQGEIASSSIESTNLEREFEINKPFVTHDPSKCDEFSNPRSIHCLGPVKATQPTNRLDRFIQGTATYASKFVPLLNNNSKGSAYSNMLINDGKSLMVDKGYSVVNTSANSQIQKIPFFAQTSISVNAAGDSETSFSFDSLMKIREIAKDQEGDLKTLLFSQAKWTDSTNSDGSTTNLGLGLRHRPNDNSLYGGNMFWDYRMTDYDNAHSRFGLGGEYLWKDLEFRNNWYMAMTEAKTVKISGTTYTERVVPGWDAEIGYRLPNNPELGVFVKAFNWDYHKTDDNGGVELSLDWQATDHIKLAAYVSNEFSAYETVKNDSLPSRDDKFIGLRFKWTAQPVKFKKKDYKENMITQMTQPVRRRYDVLLERYSSSSFINRATGT